MSLLGDWIIALNNLGLLEVLLPFLLIFTITFSVLQKTKIMGDLSKRFNVIISLVLALIPIVLHVTGRGPDIVVIINRALPNVSLLMIASLMALLLMGIFGKSVNIAGTSLEGIVVILSIIAVAVIFLSSAGILPNLPPWLGFLSDPETRTLIIAILVFGIIVWFITAEDVPGEQQRSVRDTINDMFGGVLGK